MAKKSLASLAGKKVSTLIGGPNADKLNKSGTFQRDGALSGVVGGKASPGSRIGSIAAEALKKFGLGAGSENPSSWGANQVDQAQRNPTAPKLNPPQAPRQPTTPAKGFLAKPPTPAAKPQAPRYANEAARLRGQLQSSSITPEQKARIDARMAFKGYNQQGPAMGLGQVQKQAPNAAQRFFPGQQPKAPRLGISEVGGQTPSAPPGGNTAPPSPGMTEQQQIQQDWQSNNQPYMNGGQSFGPGQIPGGQTTADPWMKNLQQVQQRPQMTDMMGRWGQGGLPQQRPQMTPPMGGFSGGPQTLQKGMGQVASDQSSNGSWQGAGQSYGPMEQEMQRQVFQKKMPGMQPPMQPGMGQRLPSIPRDPSKFQY